MKLTLEGPENPKLIEKIANGEKVSLKGYKVFVDGARKKTDLSYPVTRAWQEYSELKKSNFSDGQIRKIAQIVMACAIDVNDPLVTIDAGHLADRLQVNHTKDYRQTH